MKSDHEHLLRCWRLQSCGDCMTQEQRCSWCPFTQSCVPNNYLVPALAPAFDEEICPHFAERWEIRTHPLGCQVSTITSLTTIVTILSTLTFVLLVYLIAWGSRRLLGLHRRKPNWWRLWEYETPVWLVSPWPLGRPKGSEPGAVGEAAEQEPLLG